MAATIDPSRRRSHRQRRPAFTLAELSIVTLIISILAVVSVPRYMTALQNYQADAAARRIKVDLEYLRRKACQASDSRSITFDPTNHLYTMWGIAGLDHVGATDYVVNLKITPYNARLNSANCGGDPILVFNGFGVPDSAATIVVSSGSITRTITVEGTTGSVKIQ